MKLLGLPTAFGKTGKCERQYCITLTRHPWEEVPYYPSPGIAAFVLPLVSWSAPNPRDSDKAVATSLQPLLLLIKTWWV